MLSFRHENYCNFHVKKCISIICMSVQFYNDNIRMLPIEETMRGRYNVPLRNEGGTANVNLLVIKFDEDSDLEFSRQKSHIQNASLFHISRIVINYGAGLVRVVQFTDYIILL